MASAVLHEMLTSVRGVLAERNLRRLSVAAVLEGMSGWAYAVALAVFAFQDGGATAVALVGFLLMVPAGLAAPFLACLTDRARRERVLALSQVGRGLFLLLCALAIVADVPTPVVYLLALPASFLSRLASPAQAALIPALAREQSQLVATNTVIAQVESLTSVAGAALAGALLAILNPAAVVALTAVGALAAGLMCAGITPRIDGDIGGPVTPRNLTGDLFGGFIAVRRSRALRLLVFLYAAQTLVWGLLTVFLVVIAFSFLHLGEAGVGLLNAALGVGGLFGGIALLGLAKNRLNGQLRLGLLLWGLPLAGLAIAPAPAIALSALACVGIGNAILDVATFSLVQEETREEIRARVFGVIEGTSVVAVGLGSLLAPLLLNLAGLRLSLAVTGLLLASLAVLCRQLDERTAGRDAVPMLTSVTAHT